MFACFGFSCLISCVYGLLSASYTVVVFLASVVCPLVFEVGPRACVGFLLQKTGACTLLGETLFSLMSRVASGGVFYGSISELSMTSGNLSADG